MDPAGNANYFESIPNSNLEEPGPEEMGTLALTMESSSRRLAPCPLALLLDGSPQGLTRDAEILFTRAKHLAADLTPENSPLSHM